MSGLKENLLGMEQMMEYGYFLNFGGNKVDIYDDCTFSNLIVKVPMKVNIKFSLKLQLGMQIAMRANVCQSAMIWHRRLSSKCKCL